jgi:hypothetical protein
VPGARRFLRTVVRALALAPLTLLLMAGTAWAEVQVTPAFANTPGNADCTLRAPDVQCGSWTYWMAVGAVILGILVIAAFVVAYFRFAPRFQVQEPAAAGARAGGAPPRALAAPPAAARPSASAPTAAPAEPAAQAEAAPAATATAVAVAEPPPAAAPTATPAAGRPPSPRHEPVEPDQTTFDRVLAEQLAKGTDRRIAEGRAKAAALKAAREQAGG